MSPARTGLGLALALFAAGLGAGGALGQSQTEVARADGKAFGSNALGKAQDAAKTAPTADRVPGFAGTPSQSALFDDPDAIAAQAASAASSNEGYATVRSSLDRRPRVAVEDIEATIARGRAISNDPVTYVSGMSVGGGQGRCRELPPSTGASGIRFQRAQLDRASLFGDVWQRALWQTFIAADEAKLAAWTAQINTARTTLADRQQTTQARVTAIMAIIQKTQFLENVLANSMSPGMAASLDWSRGVAARGLN